MDDLIAFLSARLDEWERRARRALPHETGSRDEGQPPEWVTWRHSGGNSQFGLRQIAAQRAILAAYAEVAHMDVPDLESEFSYGRAVGLGEAVRHLAAVYSNHPDYRQEWAL